MPALPLAAGGGVRAGSAWPRPRGSAGILASTHPGGGWRRSGWFNLAARFLTLTRAEVFPLSLAAGGCRGRRSVGRSVGRVSGSPDRSVIRSAASPRRSPLSASVLPDRPSIVRGVMRSHRRGKGCVPPLAFAWGRLLGSARRAAPSASFTLTSCTHSHLLRAACSRSFVHHLHAASSLSFVSRHPVARSSGRPTSLVVGIFACTPLAAGGGVRAGSAWPRPRGSAGIFASTPPDGRWRRSGWLSRASP